MNERDDYTRQAVAAVRQAVGAEHDFPGWLAGVLASAVSDREDGWRALIAGRSGSWEAGHVRGLIVGTVGEDNESLALYRDWPGGPNDPGASAGH